MKIQIEIRSYYGKNVAYPACEKSRLFAEIAGTKTLLRQTIEKIHQLGYDIELVGHKIGLNEIQ